MLANPGAKPSGDAEPLGSNPLVRRQVDLAIQRAMVRGLLNGKLSVSGLDNEATRAARDLAIRLGGVGARRQDASVSSGIARGAVAAALDRLVMGLAGATLGELRRRVRSGELAPATGADEAARAVRDAAREAGYPEPFCDELVVCTRTRAAARYPFGDVTLEKH